MSNLERMNEIGKHFTESLPQDSRDRLDQASKILGQATQLGILNNTLLKNVYKKFGNNISEKLSDQVKNNLGIDTNTLEDLSSSVKSKLSSVLGDNTSENLLGQVQSKLTNIVTDGSPLPVSTGGNVVTSRVPNLSDEDFEMTNASDIGPDPFESMSPNESLLTRLGAPANEEITSLSDFASSIPERMLIRQAVPGSTSNVIGDIINQQRASLPQREDEEQSTTEEEPTNLEESNTEEPASALEDSGELAEESSSLSSTLNEGLNSASKSLGELTEDTLELDESPAGLALTGILGLATLATEFGELFEDPKPLPVLQNAPIAGI